MPSMMRALSIAKAVLKAGGWSSVLLVRLCCGAQQDQTPVFTLKVYTDLVQIPTLVLDHERQPLPRIKFERFQVSLDSGKQFAPTHVRMEGEDPLSLAILIDVGGKEHNEFIAGLADATAEMAKRELHPQDRVSIYLLTCSLLRTAHEVQPFPGLLSSSIKGGLRSPKIGKDNDGASCGTKVYLWAAMTAIIKDMDDAPGRRAMLVISNGHDDGSVVSWPKLHEYAGYQSVAMFGLRETPDLLPAWQRDHTDPLRALCESTGGIVMEGERRDLQKRLQRWIELLRGRYVVEFPRPQAITSGQHDIVVSIKKEGMAFTTIAGVSVSLPDPKITEDPNYVPSDQGSDIPVGKRRPLPH
jgi:hypothetical protein